jgi:precorrin-6B methylase 2
MAEKYQDYWDRNINQWGDKYLEISHGHETFDRPAWFTAVYNATIGVLERRLMKERYRRTIAFIDEYVQPGTVFSDLGCGTGIFVVDAAKRGAVVNAIDFSESSLNTSRRTVSTYVPDAAVTFTQANIQVDELPKSDVTLVMGVTPYLSDVEAFMANALPKTGVMCVQYTDPNHWASRIRRALPLLDVRSLQCYDKNMISSLYAKHGGVLCRRDNFASGYIDVVANVERASSSVETP